MAELGKTARNERVKITATWFNGAAIAAVAVECFAPITAYITSTSPIPLRLLNLLVLAWLLMRLSLHLAARLMRRRIEE